MNRGQRGSSVVRLFDRIGDKGDLLALVGHYTPYSSWARCKISLILLHTMRVRSGGDLHDAAPDRRPAATFRNGGGEPVVLLDVRGRPARVGHGGEDGPGPGGGQGGALQE